MRSVLRVIVCVCLSVCVCVCVCLFDIWISTLYSSSSMNLVFKMHYWDGELNPSQYQTPDSWKSFSLSRSLSLSLSIVYIVVLGNWNLPHNIEMIYVTSARSSCLNNLIKLITVFLFTRRQRIRSIINCEMKSECHRFTSIVSCETEHPHPCKDSSSRILTTTSCILIQSVKWNSSIAAIHQIKYNK